MVDPIEVRSNFVRLLSYYVWELEVCNVQSVDWAKWKIIMNYYFEKQPEIYKRLRWGN